MRDLDGLMLSVIGGIKTIYDCLRTVDRKVAMEFKHGVPGIRLGPLRGPGFRSCLAHGREVQPG